MKRSLPSDPEVRSRKNPTSSTLQQAIQKLAPVTDAKLLGRFVEEADATAFEEIVRRYGPMVMGVARRARLQNQDQEDVFQATFWLLSRDGRKIRERDRLAGWLYQVARRMSKKCIRSYNNNLLEAVADPRTENDPAISAGWREFADVLDAEILRLPTELRSPLVICLLEGATQEQAAQRLGCSYTTLRRRFDRGRSLLRLRLEKRGVGPLAIAVLALPPSLALGSVPPSLLQSVFLFASKSTSIAQIPASVTALVSVKVISMKTAIFASLFALGISLFAYSVTPASSAAANASPDTAIESNESDHNQEAKKENPKPGTSEMTFKVLDESGKPLAGAELEFSVWAGEGEKIPKCKTNSDGVAVIRRPNEIQTLRVWCSATGYATLFRGWETGTTDQNNPLPETFTFPMKKGISIGGRVVDPKENGIANVRIEAICEKYAPHKFPNNTHYGNSLSLVNNGVQTDKDGHWSIDTVPEPVEEISLRFHSEDFASDLSLPFSIIQKDQNITLSQLKSKTAVAKLNYGSRLHGLITDPQGKPIPKAVVIFHENPFMNTGTQVVADENGKYKMPALREGTESITVVAPGYSPLLKNVKMLRGLQEQNFQLEVGHPLRLKVIDEAGHPVKVHFVLQEWRSRRSLYTSRLPDMIDLQIPRFSNAEGIYEWLWAPADEVKFEIIAEKEIFQRQRIAVKADEPLKTIVMKKPAFLSGNVKDAVTGKPIPKFRVYQIIEFSSGWLYLERNQNFVTGENGRFKIPLQRPVDDLRVLIEAEGYRSTVSKHSLIKNHIREQDFALEPALSIKGRILDAEGLPLKEAMVSVANSFQGFEFQRTKNNSTYKTDERGYFQLPAQPEDYTLIVSHASGFKRLDCRKSESNLRDITVEKWVTIRGKVWQDGKTIPNQWIELFPIPGGEYDKHHIRLNQGTQTNEKGEFELTQVPAEPLCIETRLNVWLQSVLSSSETRPLNPVPGEKIYLDLNKNGVKLTGNIHLSGDLSKLSDLEYSRLTLYRQTPDIKLPKPWNLHPIDFSSKIANHQLESNSSFVHNVFVLKPKLNGQYQIHGVPPGDYLFSIRVNEKPDGSCLDAPLIEKLVPITISPEDVTKGELRLPDIEIKVPQRLVPGTAVPTATLRDSDGKEISLKQHEGKYLLLHCWAGWCTVCSRSYPDLQKLASDFPKEKLAIVGLNLDTTVREGVESTSKNKFTWPQAYLAAEGGEKVIQDWQITSIPQFLLVSPEGKLVLRTWSIEEVLKVLKQ
ncbi:sigma-70 family RNA polymerase sigma factor [Telmatocola sphagniphila]|uniref:Sigma-70 family RNA polymerase sigma factor n=1 Tax=Telmatocola sphagniphila TaxID=1123043 RepID=A0A8E6EWX8_9BACT|nr:sigma-70 family RNA polymerase sigma factor [Telmatocola sphagniphila]QVL34267.1 sigma-70 family RNA polymerase sigma factor [Telmatocola sphagniphila]